MPFAAGQETSKVDQDTTKKDRTAEYKTIKGYVGDDVGPLMGATVYMGDESGRTIAGTATDMKGNFTLKYHPDLCKHLNVSYIGYYSYKAQLDTIKDNTLYIKLDSSPDDEIDNMFVSVLREITDINPEPGPYLASSTPIYTSSVSTQTVPAVSRWRVGGNIGFGFGSDITNINIAPQIGYAFSDWVTVGGGMSYNYYDDSRYGYTDNYFGMNVFANIYPIQYMSILIQPEGLRRWGKDAWGRSESQFVPCLLVGAGVVIPTGYRGGMNIMFYYDVVQDDYSPYSDRIGCSIGYTFTL